LQAVRLTNRVRETDLAATATPYESAPTVASGETIWLTRPIIDSYHTVWFELHEELIAATGLVLD
jgi:hypothetical protein